MSEWIHVITASKLPVPRGEDTSPFYQYAEGFDPNIGTPFGPDKESMFLPVSRPDAPVVNDVLLKVVQQSTVGANGISYPGVYTAPTWTVGWDQLPQDLDVSRTIKTEQLLTARDAYVATGYIVGSGTFVFPLTEEFHQTLLNRYTWLDLAVSQQKVPSNTKITFSDINGKEVSIGLGTLKTHCLDFGVDYLGTFEKVVQARARISAASTPEAVNAVTWTFA